MHQRETIRPRIRGLDGTRALAVTAVLAYHLWPQAIPGGFIGVDVFFVLSGYLITRSFSRQRNEPTRTRLASFWQHRARRILPPLLSVIAITAVFAGIINRGVLPGLWTAVVGAVTFSSNWVIIAQSTSYFAGTSAHPLQHLWSLAVEEQFYLVWPLLLLPIEFLTPRLRLWVPAGIAVASATAMAVLYVPGVDPTGVYVNTGTHLFGITFGAALALYDGRRAKRLDASSVQRLIAAMVGIVSLGVLGIATFALQDTSPLTYRGGLVAASLAAAALIWSMTGSAPGISRLLNIWPLRVLGQRSYAIYLWHWPVLTLLTAAVTPRSAAAHIFVWVGTVLLTLLAAAASWRWIEKPVLRDGWRGSTRNLISSRSGVRWTAALTAVVLTLGTTAACIASTKPSDAEQLVTAGQRFLRTQSAAPHPSPTPSAPPVPDPPTSLTPTPTGMPMGSALASSAPAPPPSDVTQGPITAVGDSVMLAAAPTLQTTFPNISINAEVSRQPGQVAPILRADAASGQLANTVVIGIGTNGALGNALSTIRTVIGPTRTLVLVTAHGDRSWIPSVNTTIRSCAAATPYTKIADWNNAINSHDDLLASDGIHPGSAGARIYAQTILTALSS